MIPGQGIVGGVSKLAKAAGGLKLAYGLGKVAKGVGLTTSSTKATNAIVEGTKAFSSALLSRMAEHYQEGREVYKLVYDDALNQLNNIHYLPCAFNLLITSSVISIPPTNIQKRII